MGIDLIRGGRIANRGARKTKTSNNYLQSLIKVPVALVSFTPSCPAGPMLSSTRSSTKDSTSRNSIATPSPFPASPDTSRAIATPLIRVTTSSLASSPSSEPSPTTPVFSTSPRDLRSAPLSSPRLPRTASS